MHLNVKSWKNQLNEKIELAKFMYRNFRIYDFGSYALNRLTPKQGYTVQNHVPYGLKARHRLDLYRSNAPRQQATAGFCGKDVDEISSGEECGFDEAENRDQRDEYEIHRVFIQKLFRIKCAPGHCFCFHSICPPDDPILL